MQCCPRPSKAKAGFEIAPERPTRVVNQILNDRKEGIFDHTPDTAIFDQLPAPHGSMPSSPPQVQYVLNMAKFSPYSVNPSPSFVGYLP